MKKQIVLFFSVLSVYCYSQPTLSLGLIANYSFSGNAFDSGPNFLNGTYTGIGTGFAPDRDGTTNGSYSFDGININYINVGNQIAIKSVGYTFSISVWVNILGDGLNLAPLFLSGAGLSSYSLIKAPGADDRILFRPGMDSNNPLTAEVGTLSALQRNSWHHIVASYNGLQTKIYVDGKLNNTVNVPLVARYNDVLINSRTVNIGGETAAHSSNSTASTFHGAIDDLRIYNRELDDCEIFTLFESLPCETCLNPTETNLVAYYPFCKNSNDLSANLNNAVSFSGVNYVMDKQGNNFAAATFLGSMSGLNYGNKINQGTNTFSISLWFKTSLSGVNQTFLSKGDGDCSNTGFGLGLNSTGNISFFMGGINCSNGFLIHGNANQNLSNGQWHQLIVTIDKTSNTVSIFVDGGRLFLLDNTSLISLGNSFDISSFQINASAAKNFIIGADNSMSQNFKGVIDEVKIKNIVLNECDAIQAYDPTDACPNCTNTFEPGIIAYYPFCRNYLDQTGNINNPLAQKETKFTFGKDGNSLSGLNFQGTSSWVSYGAKNNTRTGSFSVSTWFKTTQTGSGGIGQALVSKGFETNCSVGYLLGINYGQNGSVNFGIGNTSCANSFLIITTATGFNDGNWHNAVSIVDRANNKVRLFVDGVQQGISNANVGVYTGGNYGSNELSISGISYDINNSLSFNLGARVINLTTYVASDVFEGQQDEVKIFSRILSDCEALKQFDKDGVCATPGCSTNGDPGVVAYYPFCGNTTDASGNGHNAIIPSGSGVVLTSDRFGNSNSAYQFFGGLNDYMQVAHHPSLNFPNQSFSISLWASRTTKTFNAMMVNKGGDIQDGYSVRVNGDGQGAARFRLGQPNDLIGDYDITDNIWTNYTSTFDRPTSIMSLYEDGILIAERTLAVPYTIGSTNPLVFGQHSCCQGGNFNYPYVGKLDDIIMYNRAITGCEAYKIASGGTTCPTINDGLIANYGFCASGEDITLTGNNLTSVTGTYIPDRLNNKYSAINNPRAKIEGVKNANFDLGTQTFVVSARFKTNNTTGVQRFVSNGCATGSEDGYYLGINIGSAGAVGFGLGANSVSSNSIRVYTTATFADNLWHLATAVVNKETNIINIYIDGSKQNITSSLLNGGTIVGQDLFIGGISTLNASSNNDFWIGQNTDGTQAYQGELDDVRLYDRTLVRGEVKKLFNLIPTFQICCPVFNAPTVANISLCGAGMAILTATGSLEEYRWYNQSVGGLLLSSTNKLTTPSISTTRIYYVSSLVNSYCESIRVPVTVTVLDIPTAPIIPNISFCGISNHTLSGTAMGVINWFTASVSGSLLGIGNSLVIQNLTTSGIFYAANSEYGCLSPLVAIQVTLLSKPTIPGINGTKSVCPDAGAIGYKLTSISGNNYQWSAVSGTIVGIIGDSITVNWGTSTTGAKLKAVATDPNGCQSDSGMISVSIKQQLATETPNGLLTICSSFSKNMAYQITPTNGSSYVWFATNSSITSNFDYGITISPTTNGTVKVYVIENVTTTSTICRGISDTLFLQVYPNPDSTVQIIGKFESCDQLPLQVYSISGFTSSQFLWQIETGSQVFTSLGINKIEPTLTIAGTAKITVSETTDKGCKYNGITKNLIIYPKPETEGIFSNAIYCRKDISNTTLTASGFVNSTYTWTLNNGSQTVSGLNLTAIEAKFDTTFTNIYKVYTVSEVSEFGCVGTIVSKAIIIDNPKIDILNVSLDVDNDSKINIDYESKIGFTNAINYVRNPAFSQPISPSNSPYVDSDVNTSTSIYSYQFASTDFCKEERKTPVFSTILLKGSVNTMTGEVNLNWNKKNDWTKGLSKYEVLRDLGTNSFEVIANTNDTSFVKEAANEGTKQRYRIKAIANGTNFVSYSNSILLDFDKNPVLYTAFTPNTNDNLNNTWIIDRLNLYPNNKMTIQDKSGNLIYQQTNYHLAPWDGTQNGKNVPEGMYYFVLELGQNAKPMAGTVNIVR